MTFAASRFEYRLRYGLHALIYLVGFTAPWLYAFPGLSQKLGWTSQTVWTVGMSRLYAAGMTFQGAALLLLGLAFVLAALGAALRIWGAAYVGMDVVTSRSMHGDSLLADGPYRRTRNPLYLGTLLHSLGIALVMPPSGAVWTVVLIAVLQIRLALAEEPFLSARFGEAYAAYKARVPRFLPALTPRVPAAGKAPAWRSALLGELYFLGAALSFPAVGWQFNSTLVIEGIVVSLGLSLIARAFLPARIKS